MKFIEAFVGLIALSIAIAIIGTIIYFFPPQKEFEKKTTHEPTEEIIERNGGRQRIPDDDGQK